MRVSLCTAVPYLAERQLDIAVGLSGSTQRHTHIRRIPPTTRPRLTRRAADHYRGRRQDSALGEEIGWRGFLVPELARSMSFSAVALTTGIIWATWLRR